MFIAGYRGNFNSQEIYLLVLVGILFGTTTSLCIIWITRQKQKKKEYRLTAIVASIFFSLFFLLYGLSTKSVIPLSHNVFISGVFGPAMGVLLGFLIGYVDVLSKKKKNAKRDIKGQYLSIGIAIILWQVTSIVSGHGFISAISLPLGWVIGREIVKLVNKNRVKK